MRIQNVAISSDGLQITYIEESDIDDATGIIEARVIDVRHDVVPNALMDDLIDSVRDILEHVRVVRRQPEEQFRANR